MRVSSCVATTSEKAAVSAQLTDGRVCPLCAGSLHVHREENILIFFGKGRHYDRGMACANLTF